VVCIYQNRGIDYAKM
jgi:hypothetical protein